MAEANRPSRRQLRERQQLSSADRSARLQQMLERSAQLPDRASRSVRASVEPSVTPAAETVLVEPETTPMEVETVPMAAVCPKKSKAKAHNFRTMLRRGRPVIVCAVAASFAVGAMFPRVVEARASYVGQTASATEVKAQTPETLKKNAGAADTARFNEARNAVKSCPDLTGANALDAAFDRQWVIIPMAQGTFHYTSPFGERNDPFTGEKLVHLGVDMAGAAGTPIYAMADGEVIHAGEGIDGRSSSLIVIRHEIDGKQYTTWYVHMYEDGVLVKEGDKVKAGQHIANVGSNGYSTGPHLHFEFHEGGDLHESTPVDPVEALKKLGAVDISDIC